MIKKISKREIGPEAVLNELIKTRDEYLARAERYKDPEYIPVYSKTHEGAEPEAKIKYWTELAKAYDKFIELEKVKIEERKEKKSGPNFEHVK